MACGLNMTQNFLRRIGVLQVPQKELKQSLLTIKFRKEQNGYSKMFVERKYHENNRKMAEVERKIGYEFENKLWLVEALTHKSYID